MVHDVIESMTSVLVLADFVVSLISTLQRCGKGDRFPQREVAPLPKL